MDGGDRKGSTRVQQTTLGSDRVDDDAGRWKCGSWSKLYVAISFLDLEDKGITTSLL